MRLVILMTMKHTKKNCTTGLFQNELGLLKTITNPPKQISKKIDHYPHGMGKMVPNERRSTSSDAHLF